MNTRVRIGPGCYRQGPCPVAWLITHGKEHAVRIQLMSGNIEANPRVQGEDTHAALLSPDSARGLNRPDQRFYEEIPDHCPHKPIRCQ
jgi:hypothetical protein